MTDYDDDITADMYSALRHGYSMLTLPPADQFFISRMTCAWLAAADDTPRPAVFCVYPLL